jgi:hypothetical protein
MFAFALKNDDSVFDFVRLRPLGLILLVIGGLHLLWGAAQWRHDNPPTGRTDRGTGSTSRAEAIKSIGGLVAVAIGVGAVAALTIVAITTVADLDASSTVAISTSAFGVISAVVGAFMGIKIGTDQTGKAVDDTKAAAAVVGAASAQLTADQREQVKQDVADATAMTESG